jgi:hypothetical protein
LIVDKIFTIRRLPMAIFLLDNSLKVEICYDETEREFADNILVSIIEDCPDDEKVFRGDETNLYLTPDQACQLAIALKHAVSKSRFDTCLEK